MLNKEENIIQDTIAYQQKAFLVVNTPEAVKCLRDRKIRFRILTLLTDNPMTLSELKNELKKSDKTVYRYLNELENAGLVVQAGRRVFKNEKNKFSGQTLYTRSAKVFYDGLIMEEIDQWIKDKKTTKHQNKIMNQVSLLVGQLFNNRKGDNKSLWELHKKLIKKRTEFIETFLDNLSEENMSIITSLTYKEVQYIIDTVGLFALLTEPGWNEELATCFSKPK
ncbi:MAG: winged helix-turn-helix transcriptional regulator [Asgard group archaeon]|nr:winged helix-turn-helix transcriptional regulator [Asgard group archaeon]